MGTLARSAIGALALGLTVTAGARTIQYDSWTPQGTFSGTSVSLDPSALPYGALPSAVTSLVLDPYVTSSQYTVYANVNFVNTFKGDMYVWTSTDAQNFPDDQQFEIKAESATTFELDFNDDATGCAGQSASFTLNAVTYRTSSPCTAGMTEPAGFTPPPASCAKCTGWNESDFLFVVENGLVQLENPLPKGWSVSPASAPELDTNSLGGSLTLLAGSVAVALARRRKSITNSSDP
jgi:hypothetical protein